MRSFATQVVDLSLTPAAEIPAAIDGAIAAAGDKILERAKEQFGDRLEIDVAGVHYGEITGGLLVVTVTADVLKAGRSIERTSDSPLVWRSREVKLEQPSEGAVEVMRDALVAAERGGRL